MRHQTLDPTIGLISDLNPHPEEALDPQQTPLTPSRRSPPRAGGCTRVGPASPSSPVS